MQSSRRGFLAALTSAMVMDPERLLWIPGAKTISIPKPQAYKWIRVPRYITPGGAFGRFNEEGYLGSGPHAILTCDIIRVPESDPRESNLPIEWQRQYERQFLTRKHLTAPLRSGEMLQGR